MSYRLKSQRGFSLIEIIIAMSIGLALMLGFMSMMNAQNRMAKVVSQKLEMVSLRQTLLSMTNNPTLCACNFDRTINTAMAAQLFINGTAAPPADIELQNLRSSCDMSATAANFIAQEGQLLAGTQSNIKVSSLKITSIHPVAGTVDKFSGVLEAQMDSSSFTMQLHSVDIPLMMSTNPGSPANYNTLRIDACSGLGGGATDTPAIICSKSGAIFSGANGVSTANVYTFNFAAGDCSPHVTPDASYVGTFSKMFICGETDSWQVIQPYESATTPGFSVYVEPSYTAHNTTACPPPPAPPAAPNIEVVFVKRSTSI